MISLDELRFMNQCVFSEYQFSCAFKQTERSKKNFLTVAISLIFRFRATSSSCLCTEINVLSARSATHVLQNDELSFTILLSSCDQRVDFRFVECLINFPLSSKTMTHFCFHHFHFVENEKTTVSVSSKN